MQTKLGKPIVLATTVHTVVSLVTGTPMIEKAKDGTELLLRGPRLVPVWDLVEPVLAEQRAAEQDLPVVVFTARQLLTVATGGVVDTVTATDGRPVQARLATLVEVMLFNRWAIASLAEAMRGTGWEGPDPISRARAVELATPAALTREQVEDLVAKFDGHR